MRDVRRELAAVLRKGYDVLHLETAWSGWTALDADPAKVVVNLLYLYAIDDANSSFVDIRTGLQRALRKRAERNLLRRFGTIAAITPRLESAARKITGGKVPVYWFPFAIDSTLYRFVPAQERPTRPIVSLSRIDELAPVAFGRRALADATVARNQGAGAGGEA